MRAGRKYCFWKIDAVDGGYKTWCNRKHEFTDGTPQDNRYKYCPFCGKQIVDRSTDPHGGEHE